MADTREPARGWAVHVRYLGPTNYRGSRWVATADHPIGRVTVPYDYERGHGAENAAAAVEEMMARWAVDFRQRWPEATDTPYSILAYGHMPDGSYAFIVGQPQD